MPTFVALLLALAGLSMTACNLDPAPSREGCIARWNAIGNRRSQEVIAGSAFRHAYIAGWPTKAGDHCSATFFTRRGEPWVTFVLWVDAPNPTARFGRDIDGSRYGEGQLGAENPTPPNALVRPDGRLVDPSSRP